MEIGKKARLTMLFDDAPLSSSGIKRYIFAKQDQISRRYSIGVSFKEIEMDDQKVRVQSILYDELYRDLNALDAKAGGLCSANAITFALLTLLLEKLTKGPSYFVLNSAYILSSVGFVFCISVLFVRWSSISAVERRTLEEMVESICYVRNRRTIRYRLAVYASIISAIVVCVYSIGSKMTY